MSRRLAAQRRRNYTTITIIMITISITLIASTIITNSRLRVRALWVFVLHVRLRVWGRRFLAWGERQAATSRHLGSRVWGLVIKATT